MSNIIEIVVRSRDEASSHLGGIGKAAGFALGMIATGAAAAGVAAVGMGIKTAASMEQAKISYETLLGSTDKAQKHLADLTKFAANTPFELPGLIQADRLLIGAGESANNTLKSLTAWGDASGALGQTQDQFSRSMLAVSQAMGAGKLQAGDLLQITEAGIPVWKLLSEALGKPQAELRKMSEKGQLLTADVLPKLEAQMEKDYGGSMAKQSQTLNGLWSTFMDTLNMGLANAIQPLVPILKDVLPGAMAKLGDGLAWVAKVLPVVIAWFQKGSSEGGVLRRIWDALGTTIGVLIEYGKTFYGVMGKIIESAMPLLQAAFDNVKKAMEDLNNSGVPWLDLLKTLGVVLGVVAGVIVGVVIGALLALSLQLRLAAAFVKPLWEAFKIAAGLIMQSMSVIVNGAAWAFGWIPGIGPKLRQAAAEFNKFAAQVNASLANIQDRQVKVTATAVVNGTTITSYSSGNVMYQSGGGTNRAKATGGISGAATGGSRSGLTEVGEHGRELLELPTGARVWSNPDTERMLAGPGGGGGRGVVQVEWVGGNAGDSFMIWLRQNIKFRGGVTAALGS